MLVKHCRPICKSTTYRRKCTTEYILIKQCEWTGTCIIQKNSHNWCNTHTLPDTNIHKQWKCQNAASLHANPHLTESIYWYHMAQYRCLHCAILSLSALDLERNLKVGNVWLFWLRNALVYTYILQSCDKNIFLTQTPHPSSRSGIVYTTHLHCQLQNCIAKKS